MRMPPRTSLPCGSATFTVAASKAGVALLCAAAIDTRRMDVSSALISVLRRPLRLIHDQRFYRRFAWLQFETELLHGGEDRAARIAVRGRAVAASTGHVHHGPGA